MKPTRLLIKNIGIIPDADIPINKPLLVFYGEIRAGKSTILHAVQWVCGGEFPSDILRHGAKEGLIELQFDNGHIRREFYLAKDGKTVKARPIEFIRDKRPVATPVREIAALLNPFTLDQDFLVRKNETDRKKYFIELFGVDNSDLDTALTSLESEASALRSELKGYGDIDLTEQKPADISSLQAQRAQIVEAARVQRVELEAQLQSIEAAHQAKVELVEKGNELARSYNTSIDRAIENKRLREEKIADLKQALAMHEAELAKVSIPPKDEIKPRPAAPDTTALKTQIQALHSPDTAAVDSQLSNAAAQNVKAEQYQKNLARENERKAKGASLDAKEKAVKAKREEKLARLKNINDTCKVPGLKFDDEGEFSFDGTTASMLSTSQLMRLSQALSDLYPPGLGVSLLDRAESLGKSVFELVDRAKAEEKVILAAVVGERPATVPEDIGVWIVENGRVSA